MNAVLEAHPLPTFSHFTSEPLEAIRSMTPAEMRENVHGYFKPLGLWLSVDGEDDWPSWCGAENFGIASLRYRITLSAPERLLWLTQPGELLAFTDRYYRPYENAPPGLFGKGHQIDWPRVAEDYPGIVIAPYQWSLRLDERTHWYYGWDCASGCIWDASMIASWELTTGNHGQD